MVINLPLPSARMWTLVLNPPWLRPNASVAGSPFLHRLHAGVHAQWCRLHNGFPSPVRRLHPLFAGPQRRGCPRFRPCANAETGCTPSAMAHTAQANRAMAHLCAVPIESRSRCADDRPPVAQSVPSAVATTASAAPTARLLAHVFVPC
jgi:hypothetical protein